MLTKRILILFSAALNVGFVIVALTLVYQHSRPFHERSWNELVEIVRQLNLPDSQSQAALDSIRNFRSTVDNLDKELQHARDDILRPLAESSPVDPALLHERIEAADHYEKLKGERFEKHVLALRQILGNEKGALFFTLLRQHLKSMDEKPHP
jgi:hypothetical protein